MEEIRALPPTGLKVVSLFSGGGGSSLGYAMAGMKVVWASEFVEMARETYAANFPSTILDGRDIRTVTAEDILAATGLEVGELDVLDGSPPCASFSTAGKREKHWGKEKTYSDTQQRTDDLFFEYARILKGLQPKVFVAENVAGLVRGVAKGYFKEIHAALEACGYRVKARLLDAQWLGVPQCRQRVIFVGVRTDLGLDPVHPEPLPYRYSIRDALPHVTRQMANSPYGTSAWHSSTNPSQTIGAGPSSGNGRSPPSTVEARIVRDAHDTSGAFAQDVTITDRPCPAITVGVDSLNSCHYKVEEEASAEHPTEIRKFTIAELRRICSFPDDFILAGTYAQQWERCGRAVPPVMMRAVAAAIRDKIFKVPR